MNVSFNEYNNPALSLNDGKNQQPFLLTYTTLNVSLLTYKDVLFKYYEPCRRTDVVTQSNEPREEWLKNIIIIHWQYFT